tara:strand:- start:20524 stop:21387 length:864 start_codon:yes stop_codon:yes gene_type:complete
MMKKGKVLVKSPSALANVARTAGGQAVQDLFRVKTPVGRGVGGFLGGLSALTSLADASENQQDLLSGAQMAAGRGAGAYIGAGKTVDAVAPEATRAAQSAHARFNKLRGVAPPQHRAQQIAVRAQRAQQPAASPDFNVPENFQLGMLGTSMGGGNYVAPGTKGIQRNLFNPTAPAAPTPSPLEEAGLGNVDPTMMSGDARAYGMSGVPSMSMTEMGQMLPGVEQPQPPQSQNTTIGSTEVGMPAQPQPNAATMSPEEVAAFYASQGQVKNAGEPMELAFRLLKSVMR